MLRKVAHHMQSAPAGLASNLIPKEDLERVLCGYPETLGGIEQPLVATAGSRHPPVAGTQLHTLLLGRRLLRLRAPDFSRSTSAPMSSGGVSRGPYA